MNSSNGPNLNDPRQQNMQGLLNFCLANTKAEDVAPDNGDGLAPTVLSDEKREFLEQLMKELHTSSPVERLKKCLVILRDGNASEEQMIGAFEECSDITEHIDFARDFVTLGGLETVKAYLSNERLNDGIRAKAAHVLGRCAQNHPYVQEHILRLGLVDLVLALLRRCESDELQATYLFVLSAICRSHDASESAFLSSSDGLALVTRLASHTSDRIVTRAGFFLRSLASRNARALAEQGLVPAAVEALHTRHTVAHEHLVAALLLVVPHWRPPVAQLADVARLLALKRVQLIAVDQQQFQEQIDALSQIGACFN